MNTTIDHKQDVNHDVNIAIKHSYDINDDVVKNLCDSAIVCHRGPAEGPKVDHDLHAIPLACS